MSATKEHVIILKNPDSLPKVQNAFSEAGVEIMEPPTANGLVVRSDSSEDEINSLLHGEGFIFHYAQQ
ncbi:MAG: hypothetical protein DYH13_04545 [Alphaproteobacteria bacterium PRO2]|nr:hypothetical protein [Alphaproteobacteria bacterium PRO2]